MCNCGCGSSGSCVIDLTGIGQKGDPGDVGGYGGYSSLWDFSTTTTTGTTSGQLRFNSGTYASVTSIYVNTTNADGTAVSNFLSSFTNGNYFGKVRIFKKSDSTKFWMGTITASSVSGSEYTFTVSYILANSTFSNADEVVMTFSPGAQGAKPLIFSDSSAPTPATTGSWVTPSGKSYTIPAGTLATDGDFLEITYHGQYGISIAPTDISGVRAIINGTDAITDENYGYSITGDNELYHFINTDYANEFQIIIKLIRFSSTIVYTQVTVLATGEPVRTFLGNLGAAITVNDLDTNTNTIAPQIYQSAGMTSILIGFTTVVKYLQ